MAALSNQEKIVPPTLEETDFIRWGQVSTMNEDITYQNGKLKIPVSVFRKGESEPHIYPVDAYIRIFSNNTIMLISKHPLP